MYWACLDVNWTQESTYFTDKVSISQTSSQTETVRIFNICCGDMTVCWKKAALVICKVSSKFSLHNRKSNPTGAEGDCDVKYNLGAISDKKKKSLNFCLSGKCAAVIFYFSSCLVLTTLISNWKLKGRLQTWSWVLIFARTLFTLASIQKVTSRTRVRSLCYQQQIRAICEYSAEQ